MILLLRKRMFAIGRNTLTGSRQFSKMVSMDQTRMNLVFTGKTSPTGCRYRPHRKRTTNEQTVPTFKSFCPSPWKKPMITMLNLGSGDPKWIATTNKKHNEINGAVPHLGKSLPIDTKGIFSDPSQPLWVA